MDTDNLQSLSSYQTGATNQNRPVSKYFPMGYTKQKLGIDYTSCDELYGLVNGAPVVSSGKFAQFNQALYGGQLPAATGPSITWRVFRSKVGPETF